MIKSSGKDWTPMRATHTETTRDDRASQLRHRNCDAYDFIAAGACGALGGLIDIFLVGTPIDDGSILEPWANEKIDNTVQRFAKRVGWDPKDPNNRDVAHAIDFLEQKYKVNYDQANGSDVGHLFDMNTRDHHMKSLAHSPSPVGLFFSLLNQFTSTACFVSDGKLITVRTDNFELVGHDVKSKLFCGIANWIGHIMSDIAGSSITRRYSGDGMGVAIPFYELFQFCKFGKFTVGEAQKDLAEISVEVFKQGYDARFGLALAVPVVVTDLTTRLVWALRRRFQYQAPLRQCVPSSANDDLRIMLLTSSGTLCLFDGIDALVRSGGGHNAVELFARMDLIAWARFATLGLKEIVIRASLERDVDAIRENKLVIARYADSLEALDLEGFGAHAEKAQLIADVLEDANDQEELNSELLQLYDDVFNGRLPWDGDFDEHMSDPSKSLHFES